MDRFSNSEQLVIETLRAQLKRRDEDLRVAREHIIQLQSSSIHQPQLACNSSNPSIPEGYADAHGDIQLPDVPVDRHVVSPEGTSIPRSTGGKLHSRRHIDPRPSHQYPQGDEPHPHAMKRPRTMSQQTPSSHKMDRATSNLSTRSAGPFTGNIPVSPLSTFQATGPKHDNYLLHNSLMPPQPFASPMQHISTDGQQQHGISAFADIGLLPTTGVLVDPADWLARHGGLSPDLVTPFPSTTHRRDMDAPNFNMGVSVCDSMTSGPTYDNTAPMTRENSQLGDISAGGVRMVNMDSQISQGHDTYFPECSQHTAEYDDISSYVAKQTSRENALFAVGSSLAALTGHHCVPTTSNDGLLMSPDMERSLSSTSSTSIRSTSSLSARAKDTLKQQNHRAQNAPLLKPKPSVDEDRAEPPVDEKNDGKAPIAKTRYVRPRQPKVFCELCDEHREGFRGEHELRRHKDAKHQTLVKKFICVDPQKLGLPVNVQVVNPLSKCKACKAQKKYGAYYNAAAHLRRTHFKEKPSRSKNKTSAANGGEDDKRGGKGGGDWPSMHELKNWMQELYVQQDERQPKEDDDADDEIDGAQPFFADVEVTANVAGTSSPDLTSTGMASMDYGFRNPLTINTINADMAYMSAMPISSADFTFNGPANMSLAFGTDGTEYSTVGQMHSLSSTVSSSATVTPLTVFNDAQQQQQQQQLFDNVHYQYAA